VGTEVQWRHGRRRRGAPLEEEKGSGQLTKGKMYEAERGLGKMASPTRQGIFLSHKFTTKKAIRQEKQLVAELIGATEDCEESTRTHQKEI